MAVRAGGRSQCQQRRPLGESQQDAARNCRRGFATSAPLLQSGPPAVLEDPSGTRPNESLEEALVETSCAHYGPERAAGRAENFPVLRTFQDDNNGSNSLCHGNPCKHLHPTHRLPVHASILDLYLRQHPFKWTRRRRRRRG